MISDLRRFIKINYPTALLSLLFLAGCGDFIVVKDAPPPNPAGPEVANTLLQLINKQETEELLTASDYDNTSLLDLITLGTPAGYRLSLRYTELGVPLVEALKTSRDQNLLDRLFELSQWSGNDRVRAEALITAASFSDPADFNYIQLALGDQNSPGIRLAAVEALQLWAQPESLGLLQDVMKSPWSPLARVLAAQAVVSLGDNSGLAVLQSLIHDRSWIVRAMAAHYLGIYGGAEDFDEVLSALNSESQNNYVIAELAIASLKLLAKRNPTVSFIPGTPQEKGGDVPYEVKEGTIEMAPLVLKPPRLSISDNSRIAQTINNRLLYLIENRLDVPLDEASKNDPNLQDLYDMLTPLGFALQTRYSQLSVLVAEGLAGTTDPFLRSELRSFARDHSNALVRATALLSLGYGRNPEDDGLLLDGLNSTDQIIRFGAMEAVQNGHLRRFETNIISIATDDPIPAFRLYAIYMLIQFANPSARNLLLSHLNNSDWPARGMAFWFLGRYGEGGDLPLIRSKLNTETNPFVLAEIVLAMERLAPL